MKTDIPTVGQNMGKTSEENPPENRNRWHPSPVFQIILASLLTGVLTTMGSWLVVSHQQKGEQEYWKSRFAKERASAVLDEKFDLLSKINHAVIELEMDMMDFRDDMLGGKFSREDYPGKLAESRRSSFALSNLLQLAALFFDENVSENVVSLQSSLSETYQRSLARPEPAIMDSLISSLDKMRFHLMELMVTDIHETMNEVYEIER